MTQPSAFESEDSGSPEVFYSKTFPLPRANGNDPHASSLNIGQQVLKVVQDSFPRVQGLRVSDKGEVFARIPYRDVLFTVQAYPARASATKNSAVTRYSVQLGSAVPKLDEAVKKFKDIEWYFLVGGGLLVALVLFLLISAPAPADSSVSFKVSNLIYAVGLGGAGGAFLGRVVGQFWLRRTLNTLVSSDAFASKERLERQLSTGLDSVIRGSSTPS